VICYARDTRCFLKRYNSSNPTPNSKSALFPLSISCASLHLWYVQPIFLHQWLKMRPQSDWKKKLKNAQNQNYLLNVFGCAFVTTTYKLTPRELTWDLKDKHTPRFQPPNPTPPSKPKWVHMLNLFYFFNYFIFLRVTFISKKHFLDSFNTYAFNEPKKYIFVYKCDRKHD